jgi:predicted MPP superfamily phosphohydrolase
MHSLLSGPLSQEQLTIPIKNLPGPLEGMVIVQLSDFHYDGWRLSDRMLNEVVAVVQDINPDLIALTGDFITRDPAPIYPLAARLKQLPNRYGTYAVLGNHDLMVKGARETVTLALERVGIRVLSNQVVMPTDHDLALVGLPLYGYRFCQFDPSVVLNSLDPALPRIVLSHNPDSAEVLQPWRVDLQLSGHTHGGQIVLPGLGNAPQLWDRFRGLIPAEWRQGIPYLSDECMQVVKHWEWGMGLHQVGENWLYVNRGLGTYWPGRFLCPPEVTVLRLVRG